MPAETKLIQPAPVVRDDYGMYEHPELPDFDEGDGDKCKAWISQQGLQLVMVYLETDAPEEIADSYFQSDEPHCGCWEPNKPEGDGWFCLAIHDTDDGPVCWWARREVTHDPPRPLPPAPGHRRQRQRNRERHRRAAQQSARRHLLPAK